MNMDGIPYVTNVWSLRAYECQCPICDGIIKIPRFEYHAGIRLTGSLIKCQMCEAKFFAIKPEED